MSGPAGESGCSAEAGCSEPARTEALEATTDPILATASKAMLALERSLGHTSYHIGQIVQVARIHTGD
jgi:hypothetical protein